NCYPLPYTHSLLYLVSNSFEPRREFPLVGMKKFFDSYTHTGDLNATTIMCPTPADAPPDSRSSNNRHGGFGSDPATIASILSRINQVRQGPSQPAAPVPNR